MAGKTPSDGHVRTRKPFSKDFARSDEPARELPQTIDSVLDKRAGSPFYTMRLVHGRTLVQAL
jgi:hypothetical protein